MKLLAITSLLPDALHATYGLHNARLIRRLAAIHDIRSLILRPRPWPLSYFPKHYLPCVEDAPLSPQFLTVGYVPKIGSLINSLLVSRAVSKGMEAGMGNWEPDAVIAPWLFPDACGVVSATRRLIRKVPVVAVAQGTDVHRYLHMPIRRAIMRRQLAECAGIVCRSSSLQDLLTRAGFGSNRITTIHNGVDLDCFTPDAREGAPALPVRLADDEPMVLFVGNLVPVKNPELLLHVASACKATSGIKTPAFVFAGTGTLLSSLVRKAEHLGVSQYCHFVGNQPPEAIAGLMRRADVLAVPSRNEGVPNVIREALASGTPVVATSVGGIPEVLQEDTVGTLVPANDREAFSTAIRGWLSHPPEPGHIRAYAERFSWDHTVEAYTQFLGSCVARR